MNCLRPPARWIRHACRVWEYACGGGGGCDWVLTATSLNQIEEKIRHQGFDKDGVPCCCVFALSQCDDFKDQKNAVMELIESLGHLCVFLPKYHPELNFIERFWSRLKWWLRQHCEWSLRALFEKIEEACDNIELSLIRKYARTAW